MTTDINRRTTRSMTSQQKGSKNLFIYKDETNGIEYITQDQIQMRVISNIFYNQDNIQVVGLRLYDKITDIHPDYRKSIPKEVADRNDLFALAPEGYLWKEDDRGTSYFHWDEWDSLQPRSYKRGSFFNIYFHK